MPHRKQNMTDAEMKGWLETRYDVNENGCWVWSGGKSGGYGIIRHCGNVKGVHHLYWLLSGRTIPEGLVLLHGHNCSKACYNPEHLHPGGHRENALDKHRDGTMYCKLTPEQVVEIRARTDKNQTELAKEYGVTPHQVSKIISRKGWSWL